MSFFVSASCIQTPPLDFCFVTPYIVSCGCMKPFYRETMSTLSPRQTIQLLLEATGCQENYSGEIDVIHAQNWGVRHVIIKGKTYFIDKRYKESLVPALKALAAPLLRPSGGIVTYRLHDGVSVDIKSESHEEQKEIQEEAKRTRGTFKLSRSAFMAVMNRWVLKKWIIVIERGKSSTPLQELTTQYAKLA